MGIQRTVQFHAGSVPAWPAIHTELLSVGESPALRMIDNLPAFPDETPADDWRELRVSGEAGMVTLRRVGHDSLMCVVWGNADSRLLAFFEYVVSACVKAGNGTIVTIGG